MIMKSADEDGSGEIEFEEFAQIWQRKLLTAHESYIHAVFNVLDADGDGRVDAEELAEVLNLQDKSDEKMIAELIQEVDADNDGVIDFEEFRSAMLERNDFSGTGAMVGHKLRVSDFNIVECDGGDLDSVEV